MLLSYLNTSVSKNESALPLRRTVRDLHSWSMSTTQTPSSPSILSFFLSLFSKRGCWVHITFPPAELTPHLIPAIWVVSVYIDSSFHQMSRVIYVPVDFFSLSLDVYFFLKMSKTEFMM